jgi:hypothetical protein
VAACRFTELEIEERSERGGAVCMFGSNGYMKANRGLGLKLATCARLCVERGFLKTEHDEQCQFELDIPNTWSWTVQVQACSNADGYVLVIYADHTTNTEDYADDRILDTEA